MGACNACKDGDNQDQNALNQQSNLGFTPSTTRCNVIAIENLLSVKRST